MAKTLHLNFLLALKRSEKHQLHPYTEGLLGWKGLGTQSNESGVTLSFESQTRAPTIEGQVSARTGEKGLDFGVSHA